MVKGIRASKSYIDWNASQYKQVNKKCDDCEKEFAINQIGICTTCKQEICKDCQPSHNAPRCMF